MQVLQRQYLAMRSQSYLTQPSGAGGSKGGGSIPVTTRNLESLIRLSQARAKMELRDYVCICVCMIHRWQAGSYCCRFVDLVIR